MTTAKANKKTVWYKQATFTCPVEDGETVSVAWIPEHLAIVGKKIYFGVKTNKPERLWTVIASGGRKSGEYLGAHERDYKSQRQASDI